MAGRIKPTTAFRILNANRTAKKPFAMVSLTKTGKPSKVPLSHLCKAAANDEALPIKARLEDLNPGCPYVVIGLD